MNHNEKYNSLTCGQYARALGTNKGKGIARAKTSTKPLPDEIVNPYQTQTTDLDRGHKEHRE